MSLTIEKSVLERVAEPLAECPAGHDVLYIAEMAPGYRRRRALEAANQHSALLLTADKDFGELVFRLGRFSKPRDRRDSGAVS